MSGFRMSMRPLWGGSLVYAYSVQHTRLAIGPKKGRLKSTGYTNRGLMRTPVSFLEFHHTSKKGKRSWKDGRLIF